MSLVPSAIGQIARELCRTFNELSKWTVLREDKILGLRALSELTPRSSGERLQSGVLKFVLAGRCVSERMK
jgi:hypothetical protein